MKNTATLEKGDFGYINYRRKRQLIIAAISMAMVAVICLTGIIIYHSQKTIFAVLAALAALPAAKMLVGYIVLIPYKSVDESVKADIEKVRGSRDMDEVMYDVLLASGEKSMYAGVIFIKNGRIYGYTGHYRNDKKSKKNKQDRIAVSGKSVKGAELSDIEKHIKFIVDANCNYSVIKMFDDREKFLKAVETEKTSEYVMSGEEKKKMTDMNERIKKRLEIYMF